MRCPNAHEIPPGEFAFCPVCGAALEAESPVSETRSETPPAPRKPVGASGTWPLSLKWSVVLGFLTGGLGLLAPLAILLWRRGSHRGAIAAAAPLVIVVGVIAIGAASGGGSGSNPAAVGGTDTTTEIDTTPTTTADASTTATGPMDPTMGVRTRVFVSKLRACQQGVRLLRQVLGVADQLDAVKLATAAHETKSLCDDARDSMATYNTHHFSDQALDADIAVDDYKTFIGKVTDYIDTSTPSAIPEAQDALTRADAEAAAAIAEINGRRQIYGLGNI